MTMPNLSRAPRFRIAAEAPDRLVVDGNRWRGQRHLLPLLDAVVLFQLSLIGFRMGIKLDAVGPEASERRRRGKSLQS